MENGREVDVKKSEEWVSYSDRYDEQLNNLLWLPFNILLVSARESIRIFYNRGISAVILGIVYILLITFLGVVTTFGWFVVIVSIAAFFTLIAGGKFWITVRSEKKLEAEMKENEEEVVEHEEALDEIEYMNTVDFTYLQPNSTDYIK